MAKWRDKSVLSDPDLGTKKGIKKIRINEKTGKTEYVIQPVKKPKK